MKTVTLTRYYNPFGIQGELVGDYWDKPLKTLERPWTNNEPEVSAIPCGSYVCRRVDSPQYGDTFEVTDVTGRTHILFHEGNWIENSLGCILLGEDWDLSAKGLMVTRSKAARSRFMAGLEGVEEFRLMILPYVPEFP